MKVAGFPVRVLVFDDMASLKQRLGVSADLASCHTAVVDGYVIEGHVPAIAVKRLLAERPTGIGLTVPDMPIGSPGMEFPGAEPETYDVLLFGRPSGHIPFMRFRGTQEI